MDLVLIKNRLDERLNYYKKKSEKTGNSYNLIGFKNKLAVIDVMKNKTEENIQDGGTGDVVAIRAAKNNHKELITKLVKPVSNIVDKNGEKFIKLNGKILKVVSHKEIPDEIRKSAFQLKTNPKRTTTTTTTSSSSSTTSTTSITNKTINIENLKKPLNLQLAKGKSLLNKYKSGEKSDRSPDKLLNLGDNKNYKVTAQIKYISGGIKQLINFQSRSTTDNQPVNPQTTSTNSCDPVNGNVNSLLAAKTNTNNKIELKLLTENNLKLLNKMKMQAINLSMKSVANRKVDCAVQTFQVRINQMVQTNINSSSSSNSDSNEKRKSLDKTVQTNKIESSENKYVQTDASDNTLDFLTDEFPLWFNDTSMARECHDNFHSVNGNSTMTDLEVNGTSTNNNNSSDVNENENKLVMNSEMMMRKKIAFFLDLRECMTADVNGNLLIHEGVIKDNLNLVKRMVTAMKVRNIGVNVENHEGCTPLQLAIINNVNGDIVKILLDYGANIEEMDGDGNNIVHLAAKFQRQKSLKIILYHAAMKKNRETILNSFNFDGLTPLMICCISKWISGTELLLIYGADLNIRDQTSGRTALFHAAEAHCVEIVRLLLKYGANPKIKNFFGTSPHDAMYDLEEIPEIIKYLIFGKSKKRIHSEELNPTRTTKVAKVLKVYSKLQKIDAQQLILSGPQTETATDD